METTPRFINGVYGFTGAGLESANPLAIGLGYVVPPDRRAQLIYFRAGNSCDAMVAVTLIHNGKPMRIFPIAAKGAVHVPLAVVEDLLPEAVVQVYVSAPEGSRRGRSCSTSA